MERSFYEIDFGLLHWNSDYYCKLKGLSIQHDCIIFVLDHAGVDLRKYIEDTEIQWDISHTLKLVKFLSEVIILLQKENKIHRDIKPANICCGTKECLKFTLIDLGLLTELGTDSNGGTKGFTSFENERNADVFSVGTVLAWAMDSNFKVWL